MSQFGFARTGLLVAFLGLHMAPGFSQDYLSPDLKDAINNSAGFTATDGHGAAIPNSVRPELAKLLQAAQDDIKGSKFQEALAKIREAEAVGNKTPFEIYEIDFLRAAAAQGAGDNALAAQSYEAVIASGNLKGVARNKILQELSELYYRTKAYPKAIEWLTRYINEGGDDANMRSLLANAYYLNGEYARARKEVQEQIQTEEKTGTTPAYKQLQLLASCAIKQNDKAGYVVALEKMVTYYPKKEQWADLLSRLEEKSGFNDNHLALDVYRLRLAVGAVTSADDFMNMAELASQAGYPSEAKKIIDLAYKSGAFGGGVEAARQKSLQDLTAKNVENDLKTLAKTEAEVSKSKDGTGLVNVGYDYVTIGQLDKGIALMEQGIAKGGLKHVDDARLHLALAYLQADKKDKAAQIFETVQGTDGTAEIARYWIIEANHPLN